MTGGDDEPGRKCDECGGVSARDEQMYTIRIELFARAEPLVFGADDALKDHAKAIADLLGAMESIDAEEATDQVHEQYEYDLCARCRGRIHRMLKDRGDRGDARRE